MLFIRNVKSEGVEAVFKGVISRVWPYFLVHAEQDAVWPLELLVS